MKSIFDAILLLGTGGWVVWFGPKIGCTICASAKLQWNEVVEFIVSQISSAAIRGHTLKFETIGNPLCRAHPLRIPTTSQAPEHAGRTERRVRQQMPQGPELVVTLTRATPARCEGKGMQDTKRRELESAGGIRVKESFLKNL